MPELILRNSSTLKQQLQKTLAEISDLQVNVDSVKNSSQEVRTEITQKFTAMVKLIEGAHKEAIAQINNDEQVTLGQAKSMRTQLQQRCTELSVSEDQLRSLLKINDNLIFLQHLRSELQYSLALEIENPNILPSLGYKKLVTPSIMEAPQSGRRMELLRYAESLRFDVRSAHCLLTFYNHYQTVSSLMELKYPDDPLRFNVQPQILCENRWFNIKRYYCEVEVWERWANEYRFLSTIKEQNGSWGF
ncbi:hypothetical protein chiPu_0019471 [Chiloscyllium punctatum]|uniref:TRIM8/14/16/25/29/45/65 coiled-coil region domain-containing protein n=1 Tax=Chiloscyllium punctatum TaxID=137246 RepID=A0A401RRY4_CHIPU|nr:hypothetical protein [Chiloscyllium punctatum]